ncbi:MAG: dihydroorotate dehydrogenase electron transfer subunit [Chloroflexi bacterium]|nr:dihydroorotate dehydrogenase electron transfer subunit [Chloroflexota bacterium]
MAATPVTDTTYALRTTHYALPTRARILKIQTDNYRTKTFVLDAALEAFPGQFVMAWLPRFDEKPFSLVNADPVTLMITAVGPFSRLMHGKQPGDFVWLRGAFGAGYRVNGTGRRLALVGGGYGVAPLHWLARTQLGVAASMTAVIGARTGEDILYAERFAALGEQAAAQATRLQTLVTTEDGSRGIHGRVTDALVPLLKRGEIDAICACGPHGMLAALELFGQEYGVETQLSWEAYMRCGIGICGACEHEGKVLCMDGPVLRRRDEGMMG